MQSLMLLFAAISVDVEFPAGVYPTRQEFKPPTPAFRETIPTERFPRLVYFAQKSCPPCGPRWNDLSSYARPSGWTTGVGSNCHLQYCDVDENPELAELAGVTVTPAVALIERNRINQAIPYVERQSFIDALRQRGYSTTAKDNDDLRRVGCELRVDFSDTGNQMFSPGSGVNTDQGVVTCWHCVAGHQFDVECDGEVARGTVIAKDVDADVALISVPWRLPHPTVKLGSSTGVILKSVARSRSGSLAVENHSVMGRDSTGRMIQVDPAFIASQSGGGMIDENSDLAGIISGNVIDQKPFRGLVIPAETIRRIMPKVSAITAEAAPTPFDEVVRVIGLLPKPEMGFVEFGCGNDARWCQAAVKRWGCPATGIEIDHDRALEARYRVRMAHLDHLITIVEGDAITTNFNADVGAAYLYEPTLRQLRPRIEKLRAFASFIHQPPELPCTKNGNSWIYMPSQRASLSVVQQPAARPMAVWGGQQYSGPICNNPHCAMCNSIRRQTGQR